MEMCPNAGKAGKFTSRRNMRTFFFVVALVFISLAICGASSDADWPQWQGADRTGLSRETGLMKEWPASGPPVSWSIGILGEGYGTVALKGDRTYVQGTLGKDSALFCLNRADGKLLWKTVIGPRLEQDRGHGPRGTPTIDGDKAYVLTEAGDLACVNTGDGSIAWRQNILRDFNGANPHWHISESPLIDGNNLIVTPGGAKAGIVALNKLTGETVWASTELGDPAGYSSCIVAEVRGVRTIMTLTASAGVGVRARDGKLMWRYQPVSNRTANITTPIFHDNKVFYTTAYSTGCALLGLKADGEAVQAEEIYFSKEMMNHHGGVVLVDGYLYGFSNNILTCMEFATGKPSWKHRSVGKGSLTYADGKLYLLGESNVVGLADASPAGYQERGRFQIEDQGWPSWSHPVVCGGKLYIRNQAMLTCYDLRPR